MKLDWYSGSTEADDGSFAVAISGTATREVYSTATASAPSHAAMYVSAMTQATRSPTKRTLSLGNGGRSTGFKPSIGGATRSVVAARAMSAPVHTATTPGTRSAASVSIRSEERRVGKE